VVKPWVIADLFIIRLFGMVLGLNAASHPWHISHAPTVNSEDEGTPGVLCLVPLPLYGT
jgi:hypothetical protein